ncbi:MAG: DUF177 domain-containing protein [Alphaproteobacteria bacterium]|jgi:uncharacterized metal-binding protein YceD (DUF177 family)|nr:DUF177 domain-containing protein [Alphaproteobacteria bacterium]MBT5860731.1 DUF177 domain-containing protein [Alphaproteobacteria bacterium]
MTAKIGDFDAEKAAKTPDFTREVKFDAVGATGMELSITAEPHECAGLAARMDLVSLGGLQATAELDRQGSGVWARVHLIADVVQSCVVTLEPVEARIDQRFEVDFMPQDGAQSVENSGGSEGSVLDGDVAPINAGVFNLGAVVAEYLSLAIDPYPRKPGIEFMAEDYNSGETVDSDVRRPFSALGEMISKGKGKT